MARKKHNARLEKLVARNNERRAQGEVFRVETLFSSKDRRHAEMAEFLGELPRGGASDFIRQAVWEKKQRDEMGIGDPVEQLEELYRALFEDQERRHRETLMELAELKRQNEELLQRPVMAAIYPPPQTEQPTTITPQPPTLPESGAVASSGIDMSRPRPKPAKRVIDAPKVIEQEPEELSEFDAVRLAKIMAASIRRANPGGKRE